MRTGLEPVDIRTRLCPRGPAAETGNATPARAKVAEIRGLFQRPQESRLIRDCVVADAVGWERSLHRAKAITGNFLNFLVKNRLRTGSLRPPFEIRSLSQLVRHSSKPFPVISQNRQLKCENRRFEAQHQTFVTSEQVTLPAESRIWVAASPWLGAL